MADGKHKPESTESDPERLVQLLEIELQQKRAVWKQAQGRRNLVRGLSFLFLFLIILGALVVFLLFFNPSHMREIQSGAADSLHSSPTPTATPR